MQQRTLIPALLAIAAAGCAQTAPGWESRFGDAARQAVALQVLDPGAPSRNGGPARTDGKAVSGAMKAYADGFGYAVKEAKQPEIAILPSAAGR